MRLGSLPAASGAAGWLLLSALYAAPAHAAGADVDLGGTAVSGSTDPAHPTLVSAGLWRDSLGSSGSGADTHVFRYHRTMADSTVHVGAVAQPSSTGGSSTSGIGVKVTAGDQDCESDTDSSGYADPAVFGVSVAVGDGDESDACSTASDLTITIDHGYTSDDGELPFALKVVEEAPVRDAGRLPAPPTSTDAVAPAPGSAGDEVAGRPSFASAPALGADGAGVTVTTSIGEGAQQLWRVPVSWGQRVGAAVAVPKMDAAADRATDGFGPTVTVAILDPLRTSAGAAPTGASDSADYGGDAQDAAVGAGPLLYRNRESSRAMSVPGDVWVVVSVEPAKDRDPIDVPLRLTVAVSGTAAAAPSYFPTVQAPDRGAGPAGYSPDTPFLVAAGHFAATASGNPAVGTGWWSARRGVGAGVGVLGLGCCAAGVWRVRRAAGTR